MNAQDPTIPAGPARETAGDRAASRFAISFFAAAILTIGANIALREFPGLAAAVRAALAVLAAPALVAMIIYGLRAVRAMDEMQQRIQLEALACTLGVIGLLLVVYGQIQTAFRLTPEPWTIVWPMMFATYLGCLLLVRRRYQ